MKNSKSYTPSELIEAILENGDSTIDYINSVGKARYAVVTLDLCPYVLPFFTERKITDIICEEDNSIIVFSWDANKPIRIPCDRIVRITPLSKVLQNGTGVH